MGEGLSLTGMHVHTHSLSSGAGAGRRARQWYKTLGLSCPTSRLTPTPRQIPPERNTVGTIKQAPNRSSWLLNRILLTTVPGAPELPQTLPNGPYRGSC